MENDTVECSTSGHIKQVISQAVTEESQVEAFHCSHCVLIFESKVYLFEHLNKVHGLNTEISLREAGLSPGTDKANTESSSRSSGDNFKCQRCDFKACSWDGLSEHEELCHKTSENPNVSGGVIISENLDSTLSVISANQNNEAAGTSEDPSVLSDISTSEANCTLKDLKILQESPSSSCPNSSGVFKVTAKSVIDITGSKSYPFLHTDLTTDLTKTPEQFRKETVPDSAVKRSSGKSLKGHPVKKAKLDNEEMLTEKENRQQSSSSEVSEDEDEADAAKVYSCKHCDYSDVGIRRISAHYQSDHPYIRYNSVYIQDASDHSATFRCLECPVEFLSTADLKRHYLENHPDAPDVFAMKSCGLSLVFKCFLCKFTINLLKSLKEHYKAKHATYEVENSLLFCRYSMSECQEESSQLSLDVHYQKSHPDEVITLDKIKQSACPTSHAASEMTSEKCSDSVIVVDHSETTPEACKNRSESSQTTKGESSKFPTKSSNEITTGLDISSSSLPNETFYCQFCSYTSTEVKSILGHHYAKHSMDAPIGTDDVLGYSAEMQKRQSESKMSKSPSSSQFNTSKQVKMCREKEDLYKEDYTADASETGERQNKSYACPENLFYCHKCNFGNLSVKGVIIHQAKVHRKCNSSTKCVLEYTALIHDEIRKANAKDSSSSRLPPPIINEGEEKAFFCHFCNYRHSTLDRVMRHYSKTHHGFKAKTSEVLLHTSKIHDQAQKSPLTSTQNEEAAQEILKLKMKKKKTRKHSKSLVISATPSVTTPHTKRSLNCYSYACAYKTDVIYALKTHLRKIHKVKRTVTDILRYYFRQGSLKRGYYCEFCVFRHEKAAAVYEHYQERHLGRVPCVEYVNSRLYAGPEMVLSKKKKPDLEQSGGNGTENRLLSQRSGQNKAGLSCKRCSFKSKSLSDLAHHYRMVHPLNAKLSKKTSASWRVEDQSDRSRSLSSKVFKCLYCSANFNSKQGLHIHCGLKHPEAVIERYEQEQKPKQQRKKRRHKTLKSSITAEKSLLIYKCPKCPYVNVSYQGTLTHCQMKHPAIVVWADELETGEVFASNMVNCTLGRSSNERGYLCKKCSQIHGSLTKLNAHCKMVHHDRKVYEHTDTESQPVHTSRGSARKDASVKNKTSRRVKIAKSRQAPQTETPEASPSTLLSGLRSSKQLYKCQMCTYKGPYRKYLQRHYKNYHKLDAVSIYKLLDKYNKRKWNSPSNVLKSGNSTKVKCLKCPELTFKSSQLLIDHYSTFHRSEWKLDFTVLSLGLRKKKNTGVYKCDHCNTQLNGIRMVCYHMDRHRARMLEKAKAAQRKESLISTTLEQESSEPCRQDEMTTLETVNEVNRWNGTPVQSAATSELSDVQQPELESNGDKHTCRQCGRMFMSLKGLHSHEHSHAALAAIKKLDNSSTSGLKHNISKYLIHKSGTLRPFLCSCCTYRTTIFGLWRSHFMKKHNDLIMAAAETEDKDESEERFKESSNSSEKMNSLPEIDERPELIKGSLYLEPPDVRRQLNHYTMMAQSSIKSKVNVQLSKLPENSVLHCEFCNFSTGHLSSIRRHCLNRHGKKILRCKDCNFFTGLRKTLEMHMETGHSTCQSKPTHQKDLCCPFCLYQTKNKNNMIDHIVLHREERVVPIEVRRPKLSRCHQGIIFGSKKVMKNHELVGQGSLDQLEASVDNVPVTEEEEEHLSNMDQLDKDREDVEMEDLFADCDEVPQTENLEENYTTEKSALQIRECQETNGESPGETSESDIQHENAKPNSTVQQELQKQAELVLLETAREQETGKVEQSGTEVKITDTPCEDYGNPEEERQTNENQAQPEFTESGDKQQMETGNVEQSVTEVKITDTPCEDYGNPEEERQTYENQAQPEFTESGDKQQMETGNVEQSVTEVKITDTPCEDYGNPEEERQTNENQAQPEFTESGDKQQMETGNVEQSVTEVKITDTPCEDYGDPEEDRQTNENQAQPEFTESGDKQQMETGNVEQSVTEVKSTDTPCEDYGNPEEERQTYENQAQPEFTESGDKQQMETGNVEQSVTEVKITDTPCEDYGDPEEERQTNENQAQPEFTESGDKQQMETGNVEQSVTEVKITDTPCEDYGDPEEERQTYENQAQPEFTESGDKQQMETGNVEQSVTEVKITDTPCEDYGNPEEERQTYENQAQPEFTESGDKQQMETGNVEQSVTEVKITDTPCEDYGDPEEERQTNENQAQPEFTESGDKQQMETGNVEQSVTEVKSTDTPCEDYGDPEEERQTNENQAQPEFTESGDKQQMETGNVEQSVTEVKITDTPCEDYGNPEEERQTYENQAQPEFTESGDKQQMETGNVEQSVTEVKSTDTPCEDYGDPEEERQTNENQAQPEFTDSGDKQQMETGNVEQSVTEVKITDTPCEDYGDPEEERQTNENQAQPEFTESGDKQQMETGNVEQSVTEVKITDIPCEDYGNPEEERQTYENQAQPEFTESGDKQQMETGNVEQSVTEVKITDTPCEDYGDPEEERQTNENQAQPEFTESGDKQQMETENDFKVDEETPAEKQDVKALEHKTLNIEAKVEDDILRHILQLANDDSKMHNKADEGKTVKMEKGTEASDIPLAEESNFPLFQNPKNQVGIEANSALTKLNIAHVNNTRTEESLKIERHMLTLPPTCAQLKMITGDILGVSFTKLKQEEVHTQQSSEQEPKPCTEIPVLEKECLKKEVHSPECFKEEEEKGPFEQKQNQESEMLTEDEERHQDQAPGDHDGMKDDDCLQEPEDCSWQCPL
uniref:uncharacterized protein LOC112435633 isoform X2 n=1 Tax=Maylandia zebra TaxID=106582 RepID=UPI000D3140BC|nr:uncharacterized protein LOC112435633 isoform X2 [Maylandia zebra]